MKFFKNRSVNRLQIPITCVCNRRCPDCCAREQLSWYNKSLIKKEVSLDELGWVGKMIGKIKRIEITGGEPTLHPKFDEISKRLTQFFDCDDFMLVTNGWLFGKDSSTLPLLMNYQRIWLSHYTEKFIEKYGGEVNTSEVRLVEDFLKTQGHTDFKVIIENDHVPFISGPYGGGPCSHYFSDMVAYYKGFIYGCCVAWSLPKQGRGIPLNIDWREHLNDIELPCENCFLSRNK